MNDEPFRSLAGVGSFEHVVDRSRFIGRAEPVASLDAAMEIVADLKSEHYDARHVCYGLRIGHGAQCVDRSNDDGEPARTGGFPLWQLLEGEEITNAIITVVRYYGGVKLGTGGLARAYREAGRQALRHAGVVTIWPQTLLALTVAYDMVGRLEHLLDELDTVTIADKVFAADVTFHLSIRSTELNDVKERLAALLQRAVDEL